VNFSSKSGAWCAAFLLGIGAHLARQTRKFRMSAYVISELEVRDPESIKTYRTIAAASIAQYGGRYLVRGGAAEIAEGGPSPKNIVVVEFPSMERLREWYASPEYAEALKVRRTALDRRLIFVEGVPTA
jgi:uncharacterized protein (DUF1330 family)